MVFKKNGIVTAPQFNNILGTTSVVGTPTITDGSKLSGGSTSSYLQYIFPTSVSLINHEVAFCGSFEVPSTNAGLWFINNDYWRVRIIASNTHIIFANSNSDFISSDYSSSVTAGCKLYYKATYTNGSQSLKVYKDNNTLILDKTATYSRTETGGNVYVCMYSIVFGGCPVSAPSSLQYGATQDLSDFMVKVDGIPVFAPFINKFSVSSTQTGADDIYEI